MSRLLIRSGKDPFTPVSAETTLTQDVFNSNSGNFLFQHSVWKALSVPGADLVSNSTLSERRPPEPGDAERLSDEFEHFVVPMANAFRPEFIEQLDNLSALIENLTIPTTVVGIGAQAAHGQGPESLAPIADSVKRFVSAVLDRSASIGVRGEFTRQYLNSLGFGDDVVDVIGCPSLYLWGRDFQVSRKVDTIHDDSPLALNLTPEVPGIGAFATAQAERHPNLTYLGQDGNDLRLLLWGVPFQHVHDPLVPVHLDHLLYQSGRMKLFVDTWTWYDFLAKQEFAYGTRFHGNVAALLAGIPALLLAHDSRTLELAEYHQMPFRTMPSFDGDIRASELYEATDLTPFNAELPHGFDRYTTFLDRNGLEHAWSVGEGDFDEKLAAANFPPAVVPLVAENGAPIAARLQWLREGMVLDMRRHPQRYDYPYEHPGWWGGGSRHARIQDTTKQRLDQQRQEINELRAHLLKVETTTFIGFFRRLARLLKRKLGKTP